MNTPVETQALEHLIEAYGENGKSLHRVLVDPLFERIPFDKQVEAIKILGKKIQAGVKLDSIDVKNVILTVLAGFGGAVITADLIRGVGNGIKNWKKLENEASELSYKHMVETEEGAKKYNDAVDKITDNAFGLSSYLRGIVAAPLVSTMPGMVGNIRKDKNIRDLVRSTNFDNMTDKDAIKFLSSLR